MGYDRRNPMTPGQEPATKKDLAELRAEIKADVKGDLDQLKAELFEAMRDMQTEILRGLEAFARGNFARMHMLETRSSSSEQQLASTNDRITALEERVLNLETRRPPRGPA